MRRRLMRSRNNRVISGVCGGIAEYFATDPTIIRLVCAAFALTGTGVIVYIIAAFIMPERGKDPGGSFDEYDPDKEFKDFTAGEDKEYASCNQGAQGSRYILGMVLIGLGAMFFARQFLNLGMQYFFPLIFIIIGIFIIFKGGRKNI